VPAAGVTAVVLNVTVTAPTAAGYVTVWPSDAARPLASNLNFVPDLTVPNLVVVRVPADGVVSLFNFYGLTHLVVDVVGWYDLDRSTEAGRFLPVDPFRTFDSREEAMGALGADEAVMLWWDDDDGSPTEWIGGIVANVTVTEPTQAGFLTVWPADLDLPWASNLNFVAGQTVPNLVMVGGSRGTPDAPAGAFCIYNAMGTTHVVVDVFGFITSAAG
jgi:hypothetical protein